MRHIIPISGKDSLATALVQTRRTPGLKYELFFNDVMAELPETYEWLERVERQLELPVHRVGRSLEEVIKENNILPSPSVRFCTKYAKIKPMEEFIGDEEAQVYFGIRADEDRVGYRSEKDNINPVYPLKELGIGYTEVLRLVGEVGLTPPRFFWKRLHQAVVDRMEAKHRRGFGLGTPPSEYIAKLPRQNFDALFAWRVRSNCYFCFFQRLYEWVGLLEHHPELFAKAQAIENGVGYAHKTGKVFSWIPGLPLDQVAREREQIFQRRVVAVIKELKTKRISLTTTDALAASGCGLFCGK